jgi:peptide/nickel transport system permease protein
MVDEARAVTAPFPMSPPGGLAGQRLKLAAKFALALAYRVATIAFQLFAVSIVVFVVLRLLPADPLAMLLPPTATNEDAERLRAALGLDRSIMDQYWIWLTRALHGDLGTSIQARMPVTRLILEALPMTIELVICSLIIGVLAGFMLGMAMFFWRNTPFEKATEIAGSLIQAVPEYLWGILLILVFGLWLHLVAFVGPIDSQMIVPPRTGFLIVDSLLAHRPDAFASHLAHLAMPAIALALVKAPLIMRLLRSSLIDVYTEDYIDSARLRGLGEARILFRHALRNAALPAVTLIGVQAAHTFGGTLLIEAIYSLPGLGNLMIAGIRTHDLPVIQGVTLTYCAVVLALNGIVDLTYLWLNPRLRAT